MHSPEYYLGKIAEYKNYQAQARNIISLISNTESEIRSLAKEIDEIIISKDTVDTGKLREYESRLIASESLIKAVITECEQKIEDNQRLYYKALEYEKLQREKEKENNDGFEIL